MATAKERAYDKIRKAILGGRFPPGFHLREEKLAAFCGVSRTPVRQAFRMLADEGLVSVRANRRCYVADVTESHAEEMFDILAWLESYSAGLAAKRISAAELAELKGIAARLEALVAARPMDNEAFLELNSEFHKAIHRASGNRTLFELIQRVVDFPHNLYLKTKQATESESALAEHRRIVEALEGGDSDYAILQMTAHLESVRRQFRHLWSGET